MRARAEADSTSRAAFRGLLATASLLTVVTALVVTTGQLPGLDPSSLAVFSDTARTGLLHTLVVVLTGTASVQVGLTVLALLGTAVSVQRRSLVPLLLTSAAATALMVAVYGLKFVVARTRPGLATVTDPEPGFPSGHSATAVVVAGTAVVLLCSAADRTRRRLAVTLLVAYVSAVGLSRLYLQLHWFSDVLAGWLIGSAIVCGVALAAARVRPPGLPGPPEPVGPPADGAEMEPRAERRA